MMFSPYYIIVAIGCFVGAAIMFTRLRGQAPVTVPAGILLIFGGIYILCRQFIRAVAESGIAPYVARGVLVVFLIYILLTYNNMKAERNAEFEEQIQPNESESAQEQSPEEGEDK